MGAEEKDKSLEKVNESLNRLRAIAWCNTTNSERTQRDINVVSDALKEADFLGEHYRELLAYSNKQDVALKIIYEKNVNIYVFNEYQTYEDYLGGPAPRNVIDIDGVWHSDQVLTKEEFYSIKEALKDAVRSINACKKGEK